MTVHYVVHSGFLSVLLGSHNNQGMSSCLHFGKEADIELQVNTVIYLTGISSRRQRVSSMKFTLATHIPSSQRSPDHPPMQWHTPGDVQAPPFSQRGEHTAADSVAATQSFYYMYTLQSKVTMPVEAQYWKSRYVGAG